MRVVLVHHHVGGKAGGGGGVRLMLELGLGLQNRGHDVLVACHDHLPGGEFAYAADKLEIRSVRDGVSELPSTRRDLARHFWLDMGRVARLVPAGADVINAHEWFALRPGRIAARRTRTPLVWTRNDEALWERVTVPGDTIYGGQGLAERAVRALVSWPDLLDARRAAAIVVLSEQQVEMVRRSYRRPATVNPMGPPERFFSPPDRKAARERLGISEETFLVMASGIIVPHRSFEDLVEAFGLLRDDPSIRALISGSDHVEPAYADGLSRQIDEMGLGGRIDMPRRSVTDAEMHDAYVSADVFVILSQRYAWGLAPLEALASGTPVIITPGAGVHDVLEGRPGVETVPAHDPPAIAAAIRKVRSDDARHEVGETTSWLRSDLAFDRYVDRMEEIYESVAGPAWATGGRAG